MSVYAAAAGATETRLLVRALRVLHRRVAVAVGDLDRAEGAGELAAAAAQRGGSPPRSRLHVAYVALEAVKVVLLPVLGIVLVAGIAA